MMGILAGLGVVFLLLGFAMKWLKRFSGGLGQGSSGLRMEVVQRLALGPKQGVAVVRIGEKLVAVSVGEGGIRPLIELGEPEMEAISAGRLSNVASTTETNPPSTSFSALLQAARENPRTRQLTKIVRSTIRSAATVALLIGVAAIIEPSSVQAQAQAADALTPVTMEQADTMLTRLAPQIDVRVGEGEGGLRLSGTVGVVVMMGLLTLLPTLVLMMTSFTRIFIVLHFLRQALGTQSAPPGHLMAALALLLTGFIMAPTLGEVNRTALEPWMNGQMEQGQMLKTAAVPFRQFMMAETRDRDLNVFLDMSPGTAEIRTEDDIPLVVLMSAFVTSELRTAFQIGFALFLPFIVIDVVVASVLMSMGMFMLPPPMIALPFKILLFVLVDGWTLIVQGLVSSFHG